MYVFLFSPSDWLIYISIIYQKKTCTKKPTSIRISLFRLVEYIALIIFEREFDIIIPIILIIPLSSTQWFHFQQEENIFSTVWLHNPSIDCFGLSYYEDEGWDFW